MVGRSRELNGIVWRYFLPQLYLFSLKQLPKFQNKRKKEHANIIISGRNGGRIDRDLDIVVNTNLV